MGSKKYRGLWKIPWRRIMPLLNVSEFFSYSFPMNVWSVVKPTSVVSFIFSPGSHLLSSANVWIAPFTSRLLLKFVFNNASGPLFHDYIMGDIFVIWCKISYLAPNETFGTKLLELLSIDAIVEIVAIGRMSSHTFLRVARTSALLDDWSTSSPWTSYWASPTAGLRYPIALVILSIPNKTIWAFLLVKWPAGAVNEVVAWCFVLQSLEGGY